MIDHVTYHVPPTTLLRSDIKEFFTDIGFDEVQPFDVHEHGWNVRWFRSRRSAGCPLIHLVEGEFLYDDGAGNNLSLKADHLSLGHFCIQVGEDRYNCLRGSKWLKRDSGSGRIWLGYRNLRVEVRP